MIQHVRGIGFALMAAMAMAGQADQIRTAQAATAVGERFELSSIKAVRPTLLTTIAALEQRDLSKAKAAFEAYDSAWNGIEFYVNTRSRPMYDLLEHEFQARIAKGLGSPNPDADALLGDAKAMLVKFDETVSMIAGMPPLNPLYDDIARLRIVRAHLREVGPALKAENLAKARKSFEAFNDNWDSIEDLIKVRSDDAYVTIEKGMIEIENALMPDKPDIAKVSGLVNDVMARYNAVLGEIAREARSR